MRWPTWPFGLQIALAFSPTQDNMIVPSFANGNVCPAATAQRKSASSVLKIRVAIMVNNIMVFGLTKVFKMDFLILMIDTIESRHD